MTRKILYRDVLSGGSGCKRPLMSKGARESIAEEVVLNRRVLVWYTKRGKNIGG